MQINRDDKYLTEYYYIYLHRIMVDIVRFQIVQL